MYTTADKCMIRIPLPKMVTSAKNNNNNTNMKYNIVTEFLSAQIVNISS